MSEHVTRILTEGDRLHGRLGLVMSKGDLLPLAGAIDELVQADSSLQTLVRRSPLRPLIGADALSVEDISTVLGTVADACASIAKLLTPMIRADFGPRTNLSESELKRLRRVAIAAEAGGNDSLAVSTAIQTLGVLKYGLAVLEHAARELDTTIISTEPNNDASSGGRDRDAISDTGSARLDEHSEARRAELISWLSRYSVSGAIDRTDYWNRVLPLARECLVEDSVQLVPNGVGNPELLSAMLSNAEVLDQPTLLRTTNFLDSRAYWLMGAARAAMALSGVPDVDASDFAAFQEQPRQIKITAAINQWREARLSNRLARVEANTLDGILTCFVVAGVLLAAPLNERTSAAGEQSPARPDSISQQVTNLALNALEAPLRLLSQSAQDGLIDPDQEMFLTTVIQQITLERTKLESNPQVIELLIADLVRTINGELEDRPRFEGEFERLGADPRTAAVIADRMVEAIRKIKQIGDNDPVADFELLDEIAEVADELDELGDELRMEAGSSIPSELIKKGGETVAGEVAKDVYRGIGGLIKDNWTAIAHGLILAWRAIRDILI